MKIAKFVIAALLVFAVLLVLAVLLGAACTKEKLVEVTRVVEVTRIVEVAKPVERIVKETVVVEKLITVEKTVVVTATPRPTPTRTPAPTATAVPTPTATPPTGGQPRLTVRSPNGGEELFDGVGYPITWHTGGYKRISIYLDKPDPTVASKIIADNVANTGSYHWTIANVEKGSYKIRVCEYRDSSLPYAAVECDMSDGYFNIAKASAAAATATPHDVTGICQVTKDGASPVNRVIADNGTAAVGAFKFSTQNNSCTIKELAFRVGAEVSRAISSLRLMDADSQVALEIFAETDLNPLDTAFFLGLDIAIPANTSKVLQVYANFVDITGSNSASSGRQVQLTLTHLKYALGNGVPAIDKTPGPGNTNPASNSTYVFAAYPSFTDVTAATTLRNFMEATFTKLKVKANGGPVALHQLPFKTFILDEDAQGNPHINAFRLFRDGVDITNQVSITDKLGSDLEGFYSVEKWSNIVWVTWDEGNEGVILPDTESTFELRGWAQGFAGDDDVGFVLANNRDNTSPVARQYIARGNKYIGQGIERGDGLSPTAGNTNKGTSADIIWSDLSATLHNPSTGSDGTADWHNGYLLPSLPLSKGWLSSP